MEVTFQHRGSFNHIEKFLKFVTNDAFLKRKLDKYGRLGVEALAAATPKDTGTTAASWSYKVVDIGDGVAVEWYNSNLSDGLNVAVLIQHGHGTRGSTYVKGIDYINPALRPIFDKIAEEAWKEVCSK